MSNLPDTKDIPMDLHKDANGEPEIGPCYGHFLPKSLPLGDGWQQACPNRSELLRARDRFERIVAAYEVAIGHLLQANDTMRAMATEIEQLKAKTENL